MPAEERSKILLAIADALEANEKMILHENEVDVATAKDDGYESSLVSRLALKPGKASKKKVTFMVPEYSWNLQLWSQIVLVQFWSLI